MNPIKSILLQIAEATQEMKFFIFNKNGGYTCHWIDFDPETFTLIYPDRKGEPTR